ncbi:MAG: hypothetical protein ABGW69_02055 [Nanoarchaeota archaeon]
MKEKIKNKRKKEKLKKLKKDILRDYYNRLLFIYNSLYDSVPKNQLSQLEENIKKNKEKENNEINLTHLIDKLKERIIEIENKLKIKHSKICRKCGSLNVFWRVKKNYIITICKDCNYHLFLKIKHFNESKKKKY